MVEDIETSIKAPENQEVILGNIDVLSEKVEIIQDTQENHEDNKEKFEIIDKKEPEDIQLIAENNENIEKHGIEPADANIAEGYNPENE